MTGDSREGIVFVLGLILGFCWGAAMTLTWLFL